MTVTDTPGRKRLAAFGRRPRATGPAGQMSLGDHIRELRNRIGVSLLAIIAATVVSLVYYDEVFMFLTAPYCEALPPSQRVSETSQCTLYAQNILDQINVFLRVGFIAGTVIASPVWLYQIGAFITPALHSKEKKYAAGFLVGSLTLFGLGAVLAYLTLSKGLELLLNIGGEQITPLLGVSSYLSYVVLMLLAFGVAFEFPTLVIFLNFVGVLPSERMRKWRRPVLFFLCIFTAVITPSQDPFTFAAMALPLAFLYECCILVARVRERAIRKREIAAGLAFDQLGDDEISPLDLTPSAVDTRPSPLSSTDDLP